MLIAICIWLFGAEVYHHRDYRISYRISYRYQGHTFCEDKKFWNLPERGEAREEGWKSWGMQWFESSREEKK